MNTILIKFYLYRLVRLHRKIYLADQALYYFMNKNYDFVNTNFIKLNETLMEYDQKNFFMSESILDVAEYTRMAMITAIKHLLKPTIEDKRIGEKRYKIIKILDKLFKISFKVYVVYFVWKKIQMYLIYNLIEF